MPPVNETRSQSTAAAADIGVDEPQQRRRAVRLAALFTLLVLLLLALGAARTLLNRSANARALQGETQAASTVYVKTTTVRTVEAGQSFTLPGTLQGFVQAPIAARAGGYLRRWHKDIGSIVRKGELLAEIESPELDQQLSQAVAARRQTAASLDLAKSTVERWEALRKRDAVSQQELEERRSNFAQARANLAAADANVERLRQLERYKRVVAPFDGVITRRNVDIGDLIDGNAGRPLFVLAQTDPLRLYVNVPQAYAPGVRAGQQVNVTQAELGARGFSGTVARTAASIDTGNRTMQVEIAVPNPDGALLPGAFVQVAMTLTAQRSLTIPANALLFRKEGTRVALLENGTTVRLKTVRLGRNFGNTVEVQEGLTGSELLVLNPSDSLAEGDTVKLAKEAPKDKPAALPPKATP